MRVLVTRPETDSVRTAARLAALGHEAVIDSVFSVEPIGFDVPTDLFTALAVTSANAVRIALGNKTLSRYRSLPLFAVGHQTGEVAWQSGFKKIEVADGDVRSLATLLANRLSPGARVLYLAGENRAQDLATLVAPSGIRVEILIVYRASVAASFSETTREMILANKIGAILHYSPRGARVFVTLAKEARLNEAIKFVHHLCLSEAVAAPLLAAGLKVRIAVKPDETALLALLLG
jgi:uroporphyrinogen-III synthase